MCNSSRDFKSFGSLARRPLLRIFRGRFQSQTCVPTDFQANTDMHIVHNLWKNFTCQYNSRVILRISRSSSTPVPLLNPHSLTPKSQCSKQKKKMFRFFVETLDDSFLTFENSCRFLLILFIL